MPLEIRELVIRAKVDEANGSNAPSPSSGQPIPNTSTNSQQDIIASCVEKVLEILRNKMER